MKQLNLLDWTPPPCQMIPFPLVRRKGKIRDVAGKMMSKTTDRHAEVYRDQVTSALLNHLDRLGVPEPEQDEQLGAFWAAVNAEMVVMARGGRRPGGDAA